jgi:hypothetical protein
MRKVRSRAARGIAGTGPATAPRDEKRGKGSSRRRADHGPPEAPSGRRGGHGPPWGGGEPPPGSRRRNDSSSREEAAGGPRSGLGGGAGRGPALGGPGELARSPELGMAGRIRERPVGSQLAGMEKPASYRRGSAGGAREGYLVPGQPGLPRVAAPTARSTERAGRVGEQRGERGRL